MKEKNNPESKLNITFKNTNKKKDILLEDDEDPQKKSSLLKKNEYAYIFLGAALLTIVVVFVFFRPSGNQPRTAVPASTDSVQVFEKRIEHIEAVLAEKLGSGSGLTDIARDSASGEENDLSLETYKQRVERVETAFNVKFDSLAERLERLEKQIVLLSQKAETTLKENPPVKTQTPVKTPAVAKPKPAQKEPILHTVQKGETLYSISKKYNTTVDQLRKLNKMSEKADIYPGNNILVR